ncbi:lysozyme [Gallibacterium anatis]|uniref:lysozyme n=1 Tax=Gallibacterium anatis TaxID=750 RepID=UPI00053123CE|nr:lysozyme [Gallibacterium anatis]KGQ64980.1 glycoside hydrolase [Gallibacterium anatis 7990]WIM85050.1 lysozyme [Gallibacterium anatis]
MMKKVIKYCSVTAVIAIVLSQFGSEIKTSQKGLELIGNAEGCVQQPYQCPNDVLTVGIGSTEASGQVIEQRKYSLQEIAERWVNDIKIAEQCVNQFANGKVMPQGAFDALTSITFNVGCAKLRNSTLFKLARQGYTPEMCEQFTRWIYIAGQKSNGLIQRRNKERALCLN